MRRINKYQFLKTESNERFSEDAVNFVLIQRFLANMTSSKSKLRPKFSYRSKSRIKSGKICLKLIRASKLARIKKLLAFKKISF